MNAFFTSMLLAPAFCTLDGDMGPDTRRDSVEVSKTVDQVLSGAEYRHLMQKKGQPSRSRTLPTWLQRFLDWIFSNTNEDRVQPSGIEGLLYYVVLAILAVVVVVMLVTLGRRVAGAKTQGPLDQPEIREAISPSSPPGNIPTDVYERRALAAAASGDYRSALRELVLGSMSWTERAGLIRYRRGLTNRDYVRAVWRQVDRRDSLMHIVSAFERVFYGRRAAESATFDDCLLAFQRFFALETVDANLED